eukprot:6060609-Amphidinium_carterae.1
MRSTSQIWAMMKCQMLGAKSILVSTPSFTFPSGHGTSINGCNSKDLEQLKLRSPRPSRSPQTPKK